MTEPVPCSAVLAARQARQAAGLPVDTRPTLFSDGTSGLYQSADYSLRLYYPTEAAHFIFHAHFLPEASRPSPVPGDPIPRLIEVWTRLTDPYRLAHDEEALCQRLLDAGLEGAIELVRLAHLTRP
jgi:hypothetical protein